MSRLFALSAACLALLAASVLVATPAAWAKRERPPVVMLVLDEFPVDELLLPSGRIDARRFPGFAALARRSTWFPNASTVYDSTDQALPAIVAGQNPSPRLSPNHLSHPRSVFAVLARHGYRVRSREEATTICPPRLCPRRDRYGNAHYNILHRRRERLEATIRSLRPTRRPVFTFHHAPLPHQPWNYLPSGRLRAGPGEDQLPDFAFPTGFGDPFLAHLNQQRHLLQIGFVDREVGRLLRRMRRTSMLDRALLVVVADHGFSWQVGVNDRRSVTDGNVDQIAPVPLFVKRPGQRRARVSRAYARTTDVLPTVASLLHLRVGRPLPGQLGVQLGCPPPRRRARGGAGLQPRALGAGRPDGAPPARPSGGPHAGVRVGRLVGGLPHRPPPRPSRALRRLSRAGLDGSPRHLRGAPRAGPREPPRTLGAHLGRGAPDGRPPRADPQPGPGGERARPGGCS